MGGEPLLEDGIDKERAASSATPPVALAVITGLALASFAEVLEYRRPPFELRRLDIAADDDDPIIPKAPAAGRL